MKLAIKGHPTRGKEVIEILEMLGGINELDLKGIEADSHYYVGGSINKIYRGLGICLYDYIIYSLEEFLEKFPYKVGDKVQHKGATSCGSIFEVEEMRWEENTVKYTLCLFGCNYKRFTLSAEYLQPYKEETMNKKYNVEEYLKVWEETEKGLEVVINDNFELKEDNGKFYIIKKQPQYPKTFIEVLNFWHPDRQIEDDYQRCYKKDLIEKFQDLLYARDAYWKIAGEQMGLGKSWDSRYGCGEWGYWIGYSVIENKIDLQDSRILVNHILVFPTEEMRDAFYNNFKDLIENCKELL